jgi:hypothetical protein
MRIRSHLTMAGQIASSAPQTQENRDRRLFSKHTSRTRSGIASRYQTACSAIGSHYQVRAHPLFVLAEDARLASRSSKTGALTRESGPRPGPASRSSRRSRRRGPRAWPPVRPRGVQRRAALTTATEVHCSVEADRRSPNGTSFPGIRSFCQGSRYKLAQNHGLYPERRLLLVDCRETPGASEVTIHRGSS